ncbi:carbohydrate-binding family 9-like protein [Rhodocytophaga aerolata]|uniref:Carbohydrate-binding family 9-like protein n=1 Tax=Rhodocytophaga aerolata TaxID=455078 RepID=A0ABT8R3P2_9BACT|nr:carbohydrate-binding family 9-like protein [Rhodocytophaga aerolata]MDO1446703.1 carbohydrate-binding family 9-like protein [Rhodocytophaga aerolata]
MLRLLFVIHLCCLYNQSSAVTTPADSVWRVKKTQDFQFKGDGSASNWNQASWVKLTQRKGNGVAYQTQVKLLYSETGIYCLFQCEDTKITATLKEDFADLYKEDVIEVFFWTDEKTPLYFEYELSPLNYELPILVPNADGTFFGWRPWHYEGDRKTRHATHISRKTSGGEAVTGWTAEFFIPYALLKPLQNVPPKPGSYWRANFYRIDYDKEYATWTWQPVKQSFHDYKRYGTLVFE